MDIFELFSFLFCLVFCFYLPGRFFFTRLKLQFSGVEQLFLSTVFGMLVFLLLFYMLSWVHIELLGILFYGVVDFLAIRSRIFPIQSIEKKDWLPLGFIGVFALLFSTPLLLSGTYGNQILYGFDDMWHIALMRELAFRFPPHIPTFSGVPLTGYHFFYDFLVAKISQLFAISPFSLHFHLFSVFLAIFWGLGVYTLLFVWAKKRTIAMIGVFLSMFGGSFAYFYSLTGHPQVLQSDGLGIMQPAFSIYNPPFSLSIVFLLFGLIVLYRYLQSSQKAYLVLLVLAAGMLPMTKVYAAMVFFSGFGVIALWEAARRRFWLLFSLVLTGALFLVTYGIFVGGQGGLIWYPLWAPIGILRAFTWYNFDNKIYVYSHLGVIHGLVATYAYGLFVFLILNLGTRIFGILLLPVTYFAQIKKRMFPSLFSMGVFVMLLTSIVIPLFFIQTGKVFEIIQLGFYYLFLCSLFAALGFGFLFSWRFRFAHLVTVAFFLLLFSLTIESSYVIYHGVFSAPAQRSVSLQTDYYRAMLFLQHHGTYDQTVMELPKQEVGNDINGLRYWYGVSKPEVTSFANKQTFLTSTGIDFKGMNPQERMHDLLILQQYKIAETPENRVQAVRMLKKNHIAYIFSPYPFDSLLKIQGVKKIYDNGFVIYQIR